jgi:hypothetical protein
MNTVLLFLLASPLLVLAEKAVPQNINELSLWLKRLNVQQVEHLNSQTAALNHIVVATDKVITGLESVLELTNGTNNATRHLSLEIDVIKTRQAYAAVLCTLQLLFVITYLIVKIILFVVKLRDSVSPVCGIFKRVNVPGVAGALLLTPS